jgi:hypothetical protein
MKKFLMGCLVVMCSTCNGCGYTQIHDPLRVPKPEPVKIEPIMDYHDGTLPEVRRDYYGRFSHPSYYNSYSPYIYSGYYQPPARIIYVEVSPVAPVQSQPVYEVTKQPTQRDDTKAAKVWQKRVSPRLRQPPKPTAR